MLLKDLFEFQPKSSKPASYGKSNGIYPFHTSSEVIDKYADDFDYDGTYIVIGDGGTANCKYVNSKFSVSDHNYVLKPNKNTNAKLVYYFLKHKNYRILADGFKGVGLKNISKTYIQNIDFNVRSDKNELAIVSKLDNLSKGIEIEKKLFSYYDELIKSRFIEMFGNVLENDKRFETCLFNEYVVQMNIGPFGSDLKNDCFVSKENAFSVVYEQKHAIDKFIGDFRYINENKYNRLKRFDIGPGDIIVSCRGTIGKCFILPKDAPHGIIHPSLMMIKPANNVNPEFLLFLLENVLAEQNEQGSGVKMAIKASELAKINVIKPNIELQNGFILFVKQIDKLRFVGHSRYFL